MAGDLLVTPVRHLAELAGPTTLAVLLTPPSGVLYLTTSRRRYAELADAGEAVFSPTEYEAILVAAESGVAAREELIGWATRKVTEPGFRLTIPIALGQRRASPAPRDFWWSKASGGLSSSGEPQRGAWLVHGWTFERLLHHFGAELLGVELEQKEAKAA